MSRANVECIFELRNAPETMPKDATQPSGFWRDFVFDDPKWDGSSFDFDKDVLSADKRAGAAMNNFDPDLRAFKAAGGKLLHYHGWQDPISLPMNSIDYFGRVHTAVGGNSVRQDRHDPCLGGAGQGSEPDRRGAQDRRQDRSHAAPVPASAVAEEQGLGEYV